MTVAGLEGIDADEVAVVALFAGGLFFRVAGNVTGEAVAAGVGVGVGCSCCCCFVCGSGSGCGSD